MQFTCAFLGIVFIAAGILLAAGRVHPRLAQWKNMPPQERDKLRILPLCRNIGAVIGLCGVVFLARGLWPGFAGRWFSAAMVVWFCVAGLDVRYIAKSGRYCRS